LTELIISQVDFSKPQGNDLHQQDKVPGRKRSPGKRIKAIIQITVNIQI
jgi:hypothetical protein